MVVGEQYAVSGECWMDGEWCTNWRVVRGAEAAPLLEMLSLHPATTSCLASFSFTLTKTGGFGANNRMDAVTTNTLYSKMKIADKRVDKIGII
mgnify:CR=1 FL=1